MLNASNQDRRTVSLPLELWYAVTLRSTDSARPGGAYSLDRHRKKTPRPSGDTSGHEGRASRSAAQKKKADDFDAVIQASSGGPKDWTTATDQNVFDCCCVLDSQGNGATWVHDPFCPCAGLTHGDACPPGSGYTKRYAARTSDNGLVFKLCIAFRQQLSTRE